ncbi:hypothetical protein BDF19DRAFT_438471 [Syncephalis fuscata]|nr:hypothetical protein BDF19DRAFT_438471 [Syncephalis fuscata]
MAILTKLKSAMRRSTESAVEDSKRIKDILSLPDIPRNVPKMVSALRQLTGLYALNSTDCSNTTTDSATDMTTSKATASFMTERRSMELAANESDDSLNITNITDGIVRALLSNHLEVANAALDLVERLAEVETDRFITQLPDYGPALVVLFDCIPENEHDSRATRAVNLTTNVIQKLRIASVIPDICKALKSEQEDTQLTAAELLAEAAEGFKADELNDYVLILSEAISHCAISKDTAMQRCAVRIYLPLVKIGNAEIQRYQMDMPREVRRNLSIGLRVMLSERKQSERNGSRPGGSLRSRASTSVMPRLHQAVQEEEDEENKLDMTNGNKHDTIGSTASTMTADTNTTPSRRRTGTGFNTLRSMRSRLSLSTTNTFTGEDSILDEQPTSPQLSMKLEGVDTFADDAFSELSRFMRADNTPPQSPSNADSKVPLEDQWDIRSAPEAADMAITATTATAKTVADDNAATTTTAATATTTKPHKLKRAVSHERLVERGVTASLRASARRIRQQVWIKSLFTKKPAPSSTPVKTIATATTG